MERLLRASAKRGFVGHCRGLVFSVRVFESFYKVISSLLGAILGHKMLSVISKLLPHI